MKDLSKMSAQELLIAREYTGDSEIVDAKVLNLARAHRFDVFITADGKTFHYDRRSGTYVSIKGDEVIEEGAESWSNVIEKHWITLEVGGKTIRPMVINSSLLSNEKTGEQVIVPDARVKCSVEKVDLGDKYVEEVKERTLALVQDGGERARNSLRKVNLLEKVFTKEGKPTADHKKIVTEFAEGQRITLNIRSIREIKQTLAELLSVIKNSGLNITSLEGIDKLL